MDTRDNWDIHRYLMKETWYKIMFKFTIKIFVGLLVSCTIGSFGDWWVSNRINKMFHFKQSAMRS